MSDIIPSYMSKILATVLQQQGLCSDYVLNLESGSSTGDGFIGQIYRVTANGKLSSGGDHVTLSFICKVPPADVTLHAAFKTMDCFEREVFVYNEVFPEFEKIQKEYGMSETNGGFFAYPKCYYASFDAEKQFAIIILEDITKLGYKMHGNADIATRKVAEVKMLFEELGKFNAVAFAIQRHKPEVWDKIKGMSNILASVMKSEFLDTQNEKHCKLALSILKPNETVLKKTIQDMKTGLFDAMGEWSEPFLSEPYNILGHGDCWLNNMMFLYQNDNLQQIKLFDFQMVRCGSPALDLVNFLFSCTLKPLRDEHYEDLFSTYYESFSNLLRKLDGDPETQMSLDVFRQHLQTFGRTAIGMGIFSTPLNVKYPFEGDRTSEDSLARIAKYKGRMCDILTDIEARFFK